MWFPRLQANARAPRATRGQAVDRGSVRGTFVTAVTETAQRGTPISIGGDDPVAHGDRSGSADDREGRTPLEARAQLARERLVGAEHVGQVAVARLQQDRLDAQVSEAGEVGEDLIGGALQRLAVGAEGVAAD